MCWGRSLHWLPITVPILLFLTFITTYVVAVHMKHIDPLFPFISDTGTTPPESCIFGQMLNIAAVLIGVIMYVRYKQVVRYSSLDSRSLRRLNIAAFIIGLLAALGISIVGNFQESSVLAMHLIGALMAFGLGAVYCWLQTVMSFKLYPTINSRLVCVIRTTLSLIATLAFITMVVAGNIAASKSKGNGLPKGTERSISVTAEWILAVSVLAFFFTYVKEFGKIHMSEPDIHLLMEDIIVDYRQEQVDNPIAVT